MRELLTALESSAFSTWLRESTSIWAYPTVLTLHTVGLVRGRRVGRLVAAAGSASDRNSCAVRTGSTLDVSSPRS